MKRILATLIFLAGLAQGQVTITAVSVSATTSNTATITWTTSSGATSQVLYGLNGVLNQQTDVNGSLVTSHTVIVSNLAPGKVYSYATRSQTGGGLVTTSSTNTFMLCGTPGNGLTQLTGNTNTAYGYGRYSLVWINDSGVSTTTPTVCGQTFTTTQTGTLDPDGSLNISLPDNNVIVPSPGRWAVTVAGIDGSIGSVTVNEKITGAAKDISADLQTAVTNQLQLVYYDPSTATFLPGISGSGTVTSVGLSTTASWMTVTNSPITGGGTIAMNPTGGLAANEFLATPNSATGAVGLRAIVQADLPFTLSGTASKVATAGFTNPASNKCVEVDSNGNLQIAGTNAACGSGGGGGVSSVGLSLPASLFTVTNSPVTGSGTLTGTFASIAAHSFLGNNTSSAAVAAIVQPGFSDLSGTATTGQLPFTYGGNTTKLATIGATWTGTGAIPCLDASGNLVTTGCTTGTVTSVFTRTGAVTATAGDYTLSQITATFSAPLSLSTNTLSCPTCVTSAAALTANAVLIGGGSQASQTISADTTTTHALFATAGAPAFRALASTDIPSLDASKITTGILTAAVGGTANGFFAVTGPATAPKTFTFPNASATVLTTNAAVTVPQGGTGLGTLTNHGVLVGAGTSNITQLAAAAADTALLGQGATSDPAFVAINSCSTASSALTYNTTTHAFGCNTISGSGTVNTGTATRLAYYATSSTAVSADSVASTDGSGNLTVASINTTGTGTAGLIYLGQGTANTVGTTSVGLTAPTAVTSYNLVFPGAAGGGYLKWTNAANIVTGAFEANIDLTADVGATILPGANGGTGIAFVAFSGPASTLKTFTLPNASATILTDNASVTVGQGGTGRNTLTNHGVLVGAGTAAITQLAAAATGTVLIGGGASADPSFSATPTVTSINGLSLTANATGFSLAGGTTSKTLTISNTLTLAGTDSTTMTFPGTSQTIAGLTTAQTWGALQTFGANASIGATAHGVLLSENTGAVVATTAGTSGQCFLSNGAAADPSFQACPAASTLAFSSLTSATNSTAAMVVGTGASLGTSGTGTITATNAGSAGIAFAGTTGSVTVAATATAGSNTATLPAVTGTVVVGATSTTTTQALFATSTAGAPAFRALAAGDIPASLSSTTSVNGTTIPSSSTLSTVIASGNGLALGTSAIASGACGTATTATATGAATTDVLQWSPNADWSAITGYTGATTGSLIVYAWVSATNTVSFKQCNPTASSITPSAASVNWRVAR